MLQAKIGRSIPTSGWDLFAMDNKREYCTYEEGKGEIQEKKEKGSDKKKGLHLKTASS